MKYSLCFLLLLAVLVSTAQTTPAVHKKQPAVFLDSVKYTRLPFIDVQDIVSISVVKDNPAKYPDGAIFIKIKDQNGCFSYFRDMFGN